MKSHEEKLTMQLTESAKFINEHDHFLVVSHIQPDGDAISSTCAVGLILEQLNKQYVLINEESVPTKFTFLQGASAIQSLSDVTNVPLYQYVIAVDCADFSRMGRVQQLLVPDVHILNIDHHATNNEYGRVNLVHEHAASTTEVLFDLIEHMGIPWTTELATCIYTGLLTDTGGFRYANTSPKVMRIASELLKHGVNANQLASDLLERLSMSHVELLKRALARLNFSHNHQIGWVSVTASDIAESGAASEDFEGIVNYPRNIAGIEVGLFFRELSSEQVKVSFRSQGKVDVARFAQTFGGGGHTLASGATIDGSLDDVIQRVISALERTMA